MLLVIVVLLALTALGGFYLKAGRARSVANLERRVQEDMRQRLESVAPEIGGTVLEGPVLHTDEGRMTLVASRAPESMVIDVAKFSGPVASPGLVEIVPVKDAGKAGPSRLVHAVQPEDPEVAAAYRVFASDDALGRKLAVREVVEKLQAIDRAVGVRSRLRVTKDGATVLVIRGLVRPQELKSFYSGCVTLMTCVRSRLGA